MTPASELLLQAATRFTEHSWLILGGEATLVQGIATDHPAASIEWQPVDIREAIAVPENHPAIKVRPVESAGDLVDVVVLPVPPDRGLARRWLLVARERLSLEGLLLLAGANAEGIRSVISDAVALLGEPEFERFGQKQRIAAFRQRSADVPTGLIWSDAPGIAPRSWAPFNVETGQESLDLVTRAGVFAGAHLDAGTRLLIDALPDAMSGSVLDVGCGVGVIGIVAAMRGADAVVMSDANLLAGDAARENVRRLALPDSDVIAGDVYSGVTARRFDLILSNPPFHRGKSVDFSVADRLIQEAPAYLAAGGTLLVVANAFLAYGKRMERVFHSVETVAMTRQFHVFKASEPR
jgi:16S rRNA (guanine1207-N2)-methyltransferase